MKVKIETACFFGEGSNRKRYEAGSVIDVPDEVAEQNAFMKPAPNDELSEAPAPKEAKAKADGDK